MAKYKYITILDLALFKWINDPDKGPDWIADHENGFNAKHFYDLGLDILGGCSVCGATLGAHNASPSKSGYWKCASGCIGDDGWTTAKEAWEDLDREADEFNAQGEDDD